MNSHQAELNKTAGKMFLAFSASMGAVMGALIVLQVELEERKKAAAAVPQNGPKQERIRSPRRKTKIFKAFNDIVDQY